MRLLFLVFISCVPIILISAYIYEYDNDKEPAKILGKLFICGIISIIPIIFLELLTSKIMIENKDNIILLFINVFVTVGLIEEGAKWIIVNKSVYEEEDFNHQYDAIIYSVFVSLGFAFVENFIYVYDGGIDTGVLRALTTIPAHTFNAVVMGYFLGKAKQEDINKNDNMAKRYMFLSLFLPILIHTIYDYLIFSESNLSSILFFTMIFAIYIFSFEIIRKTSLIKKNFDGTKFNSKKKIKYLSNSNLFIDALVKVLVITLVLIAISALSLFV